MVARGVRGGRGAAAAPCAQSPRRRSGHFTRRSVVHHAAAPSLAAPRCDAVDCDMVEGDGGHLKALHHRGQAHEQLRDHLDLAKKDDPSACCSLREDCEPDDDAGESWDELLQHLLDFMRPCPSPARRAGPGRTPPSAQRVPSSGADITSTFHCGQASGGPRRWISRRAGRRWAARRAP